MRRLWFVTVALLVLLAASIVVIQSQWLRDRVRVSLIEQAEKASGGRVEIGSFDFDWHNVTVRLNRFVIHGTEATGQAPLLAVEHVQLRLRVVSLLRREVSIQAIDAESPSAHVIVYADGHTNLPRPKVQSKILDLKLARFDIRNGVFTVDSEGQPERKIPWNMRGENLTAGLAYEIPKTRYFGKVAIGSMQVMSLTVAVSATVALEANRLLISNASFRTAGSTVDLKNASATDFNSPRFAAQYQADLSLAEVAAILKPGFQATGHVSVAGTANFKSFADFSAVGNVRGGTVNVNQVHVLNVAGHLAAQPGRYSASEVRLSALGGQFIGKAETTDFRFIRVSGNAASVNVRELGRLVTSQPPPYDAAISGPFEAIGPPRRLNIDARLNLAPAGKGIPVRGDVTVRYEVASGKVSLGQSWIELPKSRLDVSGTVGDTLKVKVQSDDSRELTPALHAPAVQFGSLAFDGTVSGPLTNPGISGHAAIQNGSFENYRIQAFSGDIAASESSATASHADVSFDDVEARGGGSVQLTNWHASAASPITATADLAAADVRKLLTLAGHKEVPVTGTLKTNARLTGTLGNPLAEADVTLTKGSVYSEPFDSISGKLQVINPAIESLTGVFASGSKWVNFTARFEHAAAQFPNGKLEFNLTSNTMPLNQIALVHQRQPDLNGFGKFHADGSLTISRNAKRGMQFDLTGLNAEASTNTVEFNGQILGDARLTAQTQGEVLTARFESNAANAAIHGDAKVQLTGEYPISGKVAFSDAAWTYFVGSGDLTFNGLAKHAESITAALTLQKVTASSPSLPKFVLVNSGPVRASLAASTVRIETARFTAPETDMVVDGSVSLKDAAPLNLHLQGNINLALAKTLSPELVSSGSVAVNATVRGGWTAPDLSGHATIRNGDFHYSDFANGLTAANGEISFSGTRATIQSLTAQSGGGKVDVTGFGGVTNGLITFRIEAQAHQVRVRYPEGISSVSDAALTFAGTSQRSETSGVITVHRVSINPKSDAATILANTVAPAQTPAAKNSVASNMNLDVQVVTAPDVALQTSVTESLQADANLRLRGTATNPALIGRITITQGEMVFFGNKYSINNGTISFFNPARIDPVLNIDLETRARGVDVILTVTGPINKLNVNYRSDPPLQFSDIVALLATGRAPSDATLAVHDTGQSQNFQQLGASALIGQAIANPVAGRLQRFFGVSRLKIDPSLTGVTGSPEARLTIEQQVTPEILFTYITDVSSTSTQLIRVEWSFNRRWSAILIREENGYVGLDFAYKKRFK